MKTRGKRKKLKKRFNFNPNLIYARDRLDEQKRYIQKQFKVNPEDKDQIKNCNAVGLNDAMEVYEYYKKIFKERLKGKF